MKFLPNTITLGNLTFGGVACLLAAREGYESMAGIFILAAAFLDLLDGAVARAVKADGELGKQLDSLADVVSFGVAPSILAFTMLEESLPASLSFLKYAAFLNAAAGAFRLARFNIDKNQTKEFKGMPIPANGMFWAALSLATIEDRIFPFGGYFEIPHYAVTLGLLAITSLIMVSTVRMIAFKFSSSAWADNKDRYSYIMMLVPVILVSFFHYKSLFISIVIALLLYAVTSIVFHFIKKS
jgi:CDP-diacylglycerol--serine O-phosphatidyltransferase